MPIREHITQNSEWTLIIDCPFNGSNTNYAPSGITLSGGTTFTEDPTDNTIQVASILNDSQARTVSITQFPRDYQTRYRLELDYYVVSLLSGSYVHNIVDAASSGGAKSGIFTQYDKAHSWWYLGNKVNSGDTGLLTVNKNLCPVGNWYHLILQRVGSVVYACLKNSSGSVIDETEYDSAGSFVATNDNGNTLKIGKGSYSGRYLNGYIKNLKVWLHKI